MATSIADVAVKGGVLVSAEEMRRADVFVKDGLIDSIEPADSSKSASRVVDASGKFILPGIIDAHLHPVYADRIDTLSKSAVYGGITTLIPFIGAVKAWGKTGGLLQAVRDFMEEGNQASVTDFAIHCTLMRDDLETVATDIPQLIEQGVVSFKAFMAYAKRGMKLEDDELLRVMEVIAGNKGLFAAHAESGTAIDYLEEKYASEGSVGPEFYYRVHPNITEAEAVFRVITLARLVNCPLYLPHLSTKESLDVVRLFREWGGMTLLTETCPHYLTLTDAKMKEMGALAKVGPPLREQGDVDAMWKAVGDGEIDVIGSDAAGYMVSKKEPVWGDIFKAASGLPGLETMFTLVYDEGVNRGRITLPLLVKLTCENPAKIFGLYPRKGVIEPGSDADLVLFDPTLSFTIKAETQRVKSDYTMHEGRDCLGAPVFVMQRGKVLLENGQLRAEAGQGRYLPAIVD